MVRQLVEGCSEVVHVARLAAVVKVVEGTLRVDGSTEPCVLHV